MAMNGRQSLVMDVRDRPDLDLSLPPIALDWKLDFASGELKQALAYWNSCRGERKRPTRADLNPVDMSKFLKNVALFDVRYTSTTVRAFRVRLAGTNVEQVYGPISGHVIDEVLPAEIAARWQWCLDAVCEADRPLRLTGRVGFEDKYWLTGEILVAPLGDEMRPVSMIFAAFVWQRRSEPRIAV